MISQFFMTLAEGFAVWLLGLLPDLDWLDGMVVTASNSVGSVMAAAGSLSNWFPWPVLLSTAVIVLGAYFTLFMLKMLRVLLAHVPFIGGRG